MNKLTLTDSILLYQGRVTSTIVNETQLKYTSYFYTVFIVHNILIITLLIGIQQ